jgi:3-hydroxyisobutyrate dehydrogenase-like beta-hydroxyacid dehydrogenase
MSLQVGFIGLGSMGFGMAENLLRHDIDLTVHDTRAGVAERLVTSGARVANSPSEVAERSEIILVNVLNDEQVSQVLFGDSEKAGIVQTATRGSLVVIHSTISPEACQRFSLALSEEGLHVIDAPLSGGGPHAASAGTLTLIVGGEEVQLRRCEIPFAAMSSRVFHVGGIGMGQVVKLVNNLLAVINGAAVTEALTLATAFGLDEERVLEVVNASTGASFVTANRTALQEMSRAAGPGQATMSDMAYKDLGLALANAHRWSLRLPIAATVSQLTDTVFGPSGNSGP